MKKLFIYILLSFLAFISKGQQTKIDSLESLLINAVEDTTTAKLYGELSWEYLVKDTQKAIEYAEKTLKLSDSLNYKRGKVVGYYRLGDAYFRQGDYAKTIKYATQTLKLSNQDKDHTGMVEAYYLIGNMYNFGLKSFDKALSNYHLALEIAEEFDIKERIIAVKSSISWVYATTQVKLDSAHLLIDDAIQLSSKLNLLRNLGHCYNSKGIIYTAENNPDSAFYYINLSNETALKVDDFALISYNRTVLGEIALLNKNSEKAIDIFNISLEEGKNIRAKQVLYEAYKGLAIAYEMREDYKKANDNQKEALRLQDEMRSVAIQQNIAVNEALYEKEKQDAQIKLLEQQKENIENEKRNQIILFSVVITSSFIVIFLIVLNNRQKRINNQLLKKKNQEIEIQNQELKKQQNEITQQRDLVEAQNEKLKETNETKTKLFSIISHDLRSPIGGLKSILELANRGVVTHEQLQKLIPQLTDNVSIIHQTIENLFQWSRSQMNQKSSFPEMRKIRTIIDNQIMLFSGIASSKQITIKNEVKENTEAFFDKNQVELIFRNLINNALKFTDKKGTIEVLCNEGEEYLTISIKDTGVGIAQNKISSIFGFEKDEASIGTAGEKGSGLGLALCKEMIELNGGKITVESEVGVGSTFHVFLPKQGKSI